MLDVNLVIVIILLGGWLSGRLFSLLKLPSVLGMTLFGVGLSVFLKPYIPGVLWELAPLLKNTALIVILLRAGLGISRSVLKRVGTGALLLGFVPCIIEGIVVTFAAHYLLDFPILHAGILGFLLAAVSPAVVVPSMLDLKERGYGKDKEVPTMILAGASLDDVFTIAVFSVLLQGFSSGGLNFLDLAFKIPYSLLLGILPGICAGLLLIWLLPFLHQKLRATEKVLILLGLGILLLQLGAVIHAATLLGIMTMAFILLEKTPSIAHEMAAKLNKAWVFAEIFLFVLIGLAVDVEVAVSAGGQGLVVLALGLAARSIGVVIATLPTDLNWKERVFCIIAYLPKATVQAALGGAALAAGVPEGAQILAFAVLAIIVSAPIGLLGIRIFGKHLLNTDFPVEDAPVSE